MVQTEGQKRIQVLDGGMGTTLEALGNNVSTPLWGCDLLTSNPSSIANVHQRFAQSGADLIETATYQLTLPSLCQHAGIEEKAAKEVMQSAIPLAADSSSSQGVVLSIGPFGATLSPGQEYAGVYPPPYGPAGPAQSSSGPSTNLHTDSEEREKAVLALKDFHLGRINIFAEKKRSWDPIRWVAFETIPLLTEYEAARRTMADLQARGKEKSFWITSAYPDGLHGQQDTTPTGRATVRDILQAAVGDASSSLPSAHGVGVNCTNPAYISALADEFTKELIALRKRGQAQGDVTFVIYPDGGCVYDVVTRSWSSEKLDPISWGTQIAAIARKIEGEEYQGKKVWAGVIVGGCCKAGFDEIKALREALDKED